MQRLLSRRMQALSCCSFRGGGTQQTAAAGPLQTPRVPPGHDVVVSINAPPTRVSKGSTRGAWVLPLLLLPLSLTPALTLVAAIVVVVVVVVMATAAALPATALPDAVQLLGGKLPGAWRRPRLQEGSDGQQADVVRAYERKQPAHRGTRPEGVWGHIGARCRPKRATGGRQAAAGGGRAGGGRCAMCGVRCAVVCGGGRRPTCAAKARRSPRAPSWPRARSTSSMRRSTRRSTSWTRWTPTPLPRRAWCVRRGVRRQPRSLPRRRSSTDRPPSSRRRCASPAACSRRAALGGIT